MNKILIIIVLSLIVVGCNTNNKTDEQNLKPIDISFNTQINPLKTNWKLNEIYKDTLEFLSFENELDYWFAIFKTKNGNTTTLVLENEIDSTLLHSSLLVEWEISEFYNVGNDKVKYYDEHLISYKVINQPEYFGYFLNSFIKSYSNSNPDLIKQYINERIGFFTTNVNSTYCLIEQKENPTTTSFYNNINVNILNEKLLGDNCDGYPNIENGLYFESITFSEMPIFESPINEVMKEFNFPLDIELQNNQIKKVTVVANENQYAILYFVLLNNKWYLWAEDKCKCSA